MRILLHPRAWEDLTAFAAEDTETLARIFRLIEACRRDPFRGVGKPEPLKNELSGWWSRRVDREHRLVYRVIGKGDDQRLEIVQCRFHY